MNSDFVLAIVLCPGCGKRLPIRNGGTCACGWESTNTDRILRVRDYVNGGHTLNDVCSLFLHRIRYGIVPAMGK